MVAYKAMKVETLKAALHMAYSKDTCYPGDVKYWNSEEPGIGHCGVTALIAQALLGGEILETVYSGGRAFHNKLPDGSVVDLTDLNGDKIVGQTRSRKPKELLRGHTKLRFEKLLGRVLALMS